MGKEQRLAEIALIVMAQAQVRADDETLASVAAARSMLSAIAQGKLRVAEPEIPRPPKIKVPPVNLEEDDE